MGNGKIAAAEGRIEAQIDFVFDIQSLIHELIESKGLTRTELADRIGISKARLSQIMRPEANPTAYTIADVFHALGEELSIGLKSSQAEEELEAPNSATDKVLYALLRRPAVQPVTYAAENENNPDDCYAVAA